MGTLVVLFVVAGMAALAVKRMINNRRNGKSIQCGGNCRNCGGGCH